MDPVCSGRIAREVYRASGFFPLSVLARHDTSVRDRILNNYEMVIESSICTEFRKAIRTCIRQDWKKATDRTSFTWLRNHTVMHLQILSKNDGHTHNDSEYLDVRTLHYESDTIPALSSLNPPLNPRHTSRKKMDTYT